MSLRRCSILYPLFSILAFLLAGCATDDSATRQNQVRAIPVGVGAIDFYGTELKFAYTFTNPYEREIRILSYVWEFHVDGKRIQRGQGRSPKRIDPKADYTLELPVVVRRSDLEKALGKTQVPSQTPYQFMARVNMGAGVQSWHFDLKDTGPLNLLAAPSFTIHRFRIDEMDTMNGKATVEILIRNPNSFDTTLGNFTADFILAGQTVAQEVKAPESQIAANGTCTVPVKLDLNFKRLGNAVYRALKNDVADYTLYGKAELSTPWGPKKVNYDTSGSVKIER